MILLVFSVLFLSQWIVGDPVRAFSVSLEKPIGNSWYDLEHTAPDTASDGQVYSALIRSELNFPIDPLRIALAFSSFRKMDEESPIRLRTDFGIWCAVSPAFTKMRDEDWIGSNKSGTVSKSQVLLKFSDTYSSFNSFMGGSEMNKEMTKIHFLREPFLVGIGVGGSFGVYEVFGLDGKQLQGDGSSGWEHIELPNSLKVLTYFTFTLQSSLNLRAVESILGLQWEARLHPLIYSHSRDDHILRSKEIIMNCWGTGGALEASLPLKYWNESSSPISRLIPYMRTELNRTWGKMTQTYYANSSDTPEDETGQSQKGIRTSVNLWLIAIGMHINFGL